LIHATKRLSSHPDFAALYKFLFFSLRYKHNAGRIQRHAIMNDVIYEALLTSAAVPVVRERRGFVRVDDKQPGGLTLAPWQSGHSVTWDVTVVDTQSAVNAASAAEVATSRKTAKYDSLGRDYHFCPVATETLGPHLRRHSTFHF
jgi:hypothetical protein